MEILRKWLSCILSFVGGVLGLSLSFLSGMVVTAKYDASAIGAGSLNEKDVTKAFKVVTDNSLYRDAKAASNTAEFVWLKIFAIVTLVIAALLVVYAILKLLQNLNVLKCSDTLMETIGWVLLGLFVVSAVGLLITTNVYANAVEKTTESTIKGLLMLGGLPETALSQVNLSVKANVGAYQYVVLVVSILALVLNSVNRLVKSKNA